MRTSIPKFRSLPRAWQRRICGKRRVRMTPIKFVNGARCRYKCALAITQDSDIDHVGDNSDPRLCDLLQGYVLALLSAFPIHSLS